MADTGVPFLKDTVIVDDPQGVNANNRSPSNSLTSEKIPCAPYSIRKVRCAAVFILQGLP